MDTRRGLLELAEKIECYKNKPFAPVFCIDSECKFNCKPKNALPYCHTVSLLEEAASMMEQAACQLRSQEPVKPIRKNHPTVVKDINARNKWISVEDRLPKDSIKVLCRVAMLCDYPDCEQYDVEDYFICEGHWDANPSSRLGGWYINRRPDISVKAEKVTHWMPLPEPPEVEDAAETD